MNTRDYNLDIILKHNIVGLKKYLLSKFPDIYNDIINHCNLLDNSYTFGHMVFWYVHNIVDFPSCSVCGKPNKRKILFKHGYGRNVCSSSCATKHPDAVSKSKQTCLLKYGTEFVTQTDNQKQKSNDTKLEKYGCESGWNQENLDKRKQTCILKYGKEHVLQLSEVRIKSKETCLKKYGTEFSTQSDICNRKRKETCFRNYGVDTPLKSIEIQHKIRNILLNKYGVDNALKVPSISKRQTDTRNSSYFYDRISSNDFVVPLFTADDYIQNISANFRWKCKKCKFEFESKRDGNYNNIARCPKCYPIESSITSTYQIDLENFIRGIGVDVLISNRQIIKPYELDIYIPSKKLAIELDGTYWHTEQFRYDQNYHLNKTTKCEEQGIQLIHIFEDEWINKQDIVKSRIRNILGLYDSKIYARKCFISIVDNKMKDDFLNTNHIQGSCVSKINLGLFYNNELVSIMTFGSYRKALGRSAVENEFELIRFCSKLNYHIPGAASKLFTYFIRNYNPIKILSYADRRWSVGNLYNKLGFSLYRVSSPNYWYIIKGKREYRFGWRKSELHHKLLNFDPNLTECENMKNNGHYRIWDCGNLVFLWDK